MNNYTDYANSVTIAGNTEIITNCIEKKKRVSFEPNLSEKELNSILIEHCYSRPQNRTLEARFLRPTKTLFIPQRTRRKSNNPLAPIQDCDDIIDIETLPPEQPIIYDVTKAKYVMEECERHASFARPNTDDSCDWEEKINRTNWTHLQSRIFSGVVNILNSDNMARLATAGSRNEPIARRNITDKSVARFRQLMAGILWETKLAQWLHVLLLDNLSSSYLAIYLDILQTLKSKLPTFVDKMMYGPISNNRIGSTSNESLYPLLKRPWDPVAPSLNQDKPKKLPGNPIIIVVPSAPFTSSTNQFKRLHKWITSLSNLATVITVYTNIGTTAQRMTMANCLDQMFAATRGKILEVKDEYPGRSIILAGFNSGASLALQVAQVEPILCVLCLGFSLLTAEGKRGDPDDNLLELQCPVLFVIGECSNTSLQEDMEDLRERMRVETGLIVVGCADDNLRVSKKKKKSEGLTQGVVDRCIVDEIGEFVSGLLLSPYPPQIRMSPAHMSDSNKASLERKRNNSNGSSVDSEPSSPTPRITRPGHTNLSSSFGRPPGSKSKMKQKWTLQLPPGTSSSPSPSTSPTPSTISESQLNDNTSSSKSPTHDINNDTQIPQENSDDKRKTSDIAGVQIPFRGNPPGTQIKQTLSGIKVLENVSLNSGNTKFISHAGRAIDLSKITILNSAGQHKSANNYGNIVIMSDAKAKTSNPSIKEVKYITSKKQLMGARPPRPTKKVPYVTAPSNLSLPTNLTSQDIMDLPIIFADDNQMLANNVIQPNDMSAANITPVSSRSSNSGKIVFINKQVPVLNTSVFSPASVKRQSAPIQIRNNANSVKYAKIILSKRSLPEEEKSGTAGNTTADVPVKKTESSANLVTDIESQLVAATLPNPNFNKSDVANDSRRNEGTHPPQTPQLILNNVVGKRLNLSSEDEAIVPEKKFKSDTIPP